MRTGASDLLDDIDLVDWLDDQGIEYKGISADINLRECPFCGDTRWKVYFSTTKKRGLCFHAPCDARFNLFSFARKHLACDNAATVRHFEAYARGAGIVSSKPVAVAPYPKAAGWEMPESIALPTPEGHTHPFLVDRHITPATQALFGLRWCQEGFFPYVDLEGETRKQRFSERVIIPVCDLDGSLQCFQGRDATGVSDKRYLFPIGLPSSGRLLYGGQFAYGKSHLIICEGVFDVLATHQAIDGHSDWRDAVAVGSFGLSLSSSSEDGDDQLGRLLRLVRVGLKTVTIMWDGEHAAFKRAVEAGTMLRRQGLSVRIAALPPDKDPNEVPTAVVRSTLMEAVPLTSLTEITLTLDNPYQRRD